MSFFKENIHPWTLAKQDQATFTTHILATPTIGMDNSFIVQRPGWPDAIDKKPIKSH